jgi:hypothetical protein
MKKLIIAVTLSITLLCVPVRAATVEDLDKRIAELQVQMKAVNAILRERGIYVPKLASVPAQSYDNQLPMIVDHEAALAQENANLHKEFQRQQAEIAAHGDILEKLGKDTSTLHKGMHRVRSVKYPEAVIWEKKNKDETYTCDISGIPNIQAHQSTFDMSRRESLDGPTPSGSDGAETMP